MGQYFIPQDFTSFINKDCYLVCHLYFFILLLQIQVENVAPPVRGKKMSSLFVNLKGGIISAIHQIGIPLTDTMQSWRGLT